MDFAMIAPPEIHHLFVPSTCTWQYLVACPNTKHAVIIDPVLDKPYDAKERELSTQAADHLLMLIYRYQYRIERILETHARDQSLSSAWYLRTQIRERFGYAPRVPIGKSLDFVQRFFVRNGAYHDGWADGFDQGFFDGQTFAVGQIIAEVIALPAESPRHVGYKFGKTTFVGESIFDPRRGAKPGDVSEECASRTLASIQRLLDLPSDDIIYVGGACNGSAGGIDDGDEKIQGTRQAFATVQQHQRMSYLGNGGNVLTSAQRRYFSPGR